MQDKEFWFLAGQSSITGDFDGASIAVRSRSWCADLGALILVVQLGGLEPPTSCSTDRRSNQLSYNCILKR